MVGQTLAAPIRGGPGWRNRAFPSLTGGTAFGLLVLAATALRIGYFGNSDYHVDEEFYFLVADRMWHGALPYIDIWDRKPIGLFLLYAALRPLSGDSMIAIQLAGVCFTAAVSWFVWKMALRWVDRWTALVPALLYTAWTTTFGGANGQSPVFYNLFMAAAASILMNVCDERTPRSLFRNGCTIMALVGVAIQFKYTPVFEGVYFGLFLLFLAWKDHVTPPKIAAWTAAWVAIAILPTAAALSYYAALGHAKTFVFANFISIFERGRLDEGFLHGLELFILVRGIPLFAVAIAGACIHWRSRADLDRLFLFGWLIAAFVGFVSIGNFYDHYALPLIAPLLISATPFFGRPGPLPKGIAIALALFAGMPNPVTVSNVTERSRATIHRLTLLAKPYLSHGCLFVYDGPAILYVTTNACAPTRFVYPDHLSNSVEQNAIGVDTAAEMRRILASKPAVIVTASHPLIPVFNAATKRQIDAALARDYVIVGSRLDGFGKRSYILHARRDLWARTGHAAKT